MLDALRGHVTAGHTRYTIAGAPTWENVQPMFQMTSDGTDIALGHNSNPTNHFTLFREAAEKGLMRDEGELPSNSAIVTTLLADETGKIDHPENYGCSTNVETAVMVLLPRLKSTFCPTSTGGEMLCVAYDPYGVHPLCLGCLSDGWVVASETCMLDIIGVSLVRKTKLGEMVVTDISGVRS